MPSDEVHITIRPRVGPGVLRLRGIGHRYAVVYLMAGLARKQLTAGPASTPYLGRWPWPCTCDYTLKHNIPAPIHGPFMLWDDFGCQLFHDCHWRWTFTIHSDCPQHGDDALIAAELLPPWAGKL